MENIIAFILGGGRGTRIYPLTKERSKPAIPFGGKYRIIDIPISNCMNSRIYRIFVLTQFNSKSLHQHINRAYRFDHFSHNFVDILPAEQTIDSDTWYQGTADAIRQNLKYLDAFPNCDTVVILSGDQVYNMDLRKMYQTHIDQNADITIATTCVPRSKVKGFGIMRIESSARGNQITGFIEKPTDPDIIDQFKIGGLNICLEEPNHVGTDRFLASMGIYFFKRKVLTSVLKETKSHDFGKEIIPHMLKTYYSAPYIFQGYWEDIGTIKSFHSSHMDLLGRNPRFSVQPYAPIYTNPRFLSPPFCGNTSIENAIISDGSRVFGGTIKNCVIGVRSHIEENAYLENVLMLGADWTETTDEVETLKKTDQIPLGIGQQCVIKNAIIDKNARIGNNVQLINKNQLIDFEDQKEQYFIKDGIIVIPKGVVIPSGTVI